jgi:hypothetical protein
MNERWVRIEWPAAMPRSIWDVGPGLGLKVRDFGEGPMISLMSPLGFGTAAPLRYARSPGTIGSASLRIDDLAKWIQPSQDPAVLQATQDEIGRRLVGGSLAERVSALQLAFSTGSADSLPELVNDYLSNRLSELAGGSVFLVNAPRQIHGSLLALCRTMIRGEQFPDIIELARTDRTWLEGGIGLESGDVLGGASYLLPAISATSPVQLGAVAHRGVGSLVLLFPEPIRSPADRRPVFLADLHQPHYFTAARPGLTVIGRAGRGDAESFLPWWINSWNRLLSELLDPATHRYANGSFDPYLMLGRYFTIQRLLACVQSILVNSGLEEFTRMELFFEAFDLMDGLGWHVGSWYELATPSTVEAELAKLKTALLGADATERVVMERCERGVEALLELRAGFRDRVERDDRATDVAVYKFLRALRNAGHGLNASPDSRKALINLMRHKANVSPDLPELVWFHLVRALCFGTWTRQRLIDRERLAARES